MERSFIVTDLQKVERMADRLDTWIDVCQGSYEGYGDKEANAAMAELRAAAQKFLYFIEHSTHNKRRVDRQDCVGDMLRWEPSPSDETGFDRLVQEKLNFYMEQCGTDEPTEKQVYLAHQWVDGERADIDKPKPRGRCEVGNVVEFPAP